MCRVPRSPPRSAGRTRLALLASPISSRSLVGGLRRLSIVIMQVPSQSFAALHRPGAADVRVTREEQDVALSLVIPLDMVMLDIFSQSPPQGALAKENHLGQALLLHRPHPALGIGIQVRAARGQHERLDPT